MATRDMEMVAISNRAASKETKGMVEEEDITREAVMEEEADMEVVEWAEEVTVEETLMVAAKVATTKEVPHTVADRAVEDMAEETLMVAAKVVVNRETKRTQSLLEVSVRSLSKMLSRFSCSITFSLHASES